MTDRSDKAGSIFGQGHNCSQAVFVALADVAGLDETTAKNVARGFGAGMGREGRVCGAVTGAIMALGCLQDEAGKTDETRAKVASYIDVAEFQRRFIEKHGEVDCAALIGVELNTDEGQAAFKEKNLFNTRCRFLVRDAVAIVEDMI